MPAGSRLGADGRRHTSWLVRKHRCCGGSWCRPTARSGAFTITSTCSRIWACRRWACCSPARLWLVGSLAHLGLPAGGRRPWPRACVFPFLALCIFTALPLPCAVFAWKTAGGETATVGECFALCRRRTGGSSWILFRLALLWLGSLLLLGPPAPLGLAEDLPDAARRPVRGHAARSSAAAGGSSAKTLACR